MSEVKGVICNNYIKILADRVVISKLKKVGILLFPRVFDLCVPPKSSAYLQKTPGI